MSAMEPAAIVRAAIRAHSAGDADGFNIEVFNDEEADVVIHGLAKTGVLYNLRIDFSVRTKADVDLLRSNLEGNEHG